jgi:hypothetical protein
MPSDPFSRLIELGGDHLPHVSGTLAGHLRRTESLLRRWGNRDALCLAGLYHAVYGTAGIRGRLVGLGQRTVIAETIGAEAEGLAYLYGACNRAVYHPRIGTGRQCQFADRFTGKEYAITVGLVRDLCELTVANEVELAMTSEAFRNRYRGELCRFFEQMDGLVSDAATRAYRRTLAEAPTERAVPQN